MTINETKKIVSSYFEKNTICIECKSDKELIVNSNKYRIRPDDAFYFPNEVFIMEYEKNVRPVESISKYLWLFRQTNWLNENIKISLLLTINKQKTESNYKIRIESIRELGNLLKEFYPNHFDFILLSYSELNDKSITKSLATLTGK